MTSNVENLILEMLKAVRNELKDFRSRFEDEMREVKARLTSLESAVAAQRRDQLGAQEDMYRQQSVIDRLAERLDRVEKRLELTGAP